MTQVIDSPERQRFELTERGLLAFATYRLDGDLLILPHVEAHPDLRGQGTAGRLMEGVVAHAKARQLQIRPVCGYAVAWLQRHPEHRDLVAS
ncbi:hypothetical protein HNR46_001264 [Haloferula luteola]|uniref:N-acetyltransferase domain-containing protein n=1 Tax=Haloferula luteola TaxID=595692 RepID=A0A840VAR2_9BACT|nr:GNAT family N-acetyltransferase [Haloferula luteola]MBB5351030.1 hypothetical protein [Haloferula luteola]